MFKQSLFMTFILSATLYAMDCAAAKTTTNVTLEKIKQQLQQQFIKDKVSILGVNWKYKKPSISSPLEQTVIDYLPEMIQGKEPVLSRLIRDYACTKLAHALKEYIIKHLPEISHTSLIKDLIHRHNRFKKEIRYRPVLIQALLEQWNTINKKQRHMMCKLLFEYSHDEEEMPQLQSLQEDLNEITQKIGLPFFGIILTDKSLARVALSDKNGIIQMRPALNDVCDKSHLLAAMAHELGHKEAKPIMKDINPWLHFGIKPSDEKKKNEEKRIEEIYADMLLAPSFGVCLDAAKALVYAWRIEPNYQGNETHPASLVRMQYLWRLHRKLKYDVAYLKARFWKLGFIVRSWARHQRLVPEEIKSRYAQTIGYSHSEGLTLQKKATIASLKHLQQTFPIVKKQLNLTDATMINGFTKMSKREFNRYSNELKDCTTLVYKHLAREVIQMERFKGV